MANGDALRFLLKYTSLAQILLLIFDNIGTQAARMNG